jgi:hypothetical protein
VPAPADVSTEVEVFQILELGASRPYTMATLITATEPGGQPLSDDLIQELLAIDPETLTSVLFAAQQVLLGKRYWFRIQQRFLLLAKYGTFHFSIDHLIDFSNMLSH